MRLNFEIEMRRIKLIHVVIMIIFVISAIFYVNYDFKRMEKINEQLNIEYPLIKNDEQVDGIVISVFLPEGFRNYPYSASIILDSSIKRSLLSYSKPKGLVVDDVLTVGSRLIKKSGSDTLCIQNINSGDTTIYYFKLDKYDD